MKCLRIFVVVAGLLILAGAGRAQDDTLSVRDRVWILSKTYQAATLYFAHWETAAYTPAQIDSVYEAFLTRAVAPQSRKEFMFLMREYIALFHNTHCWYTDFAEYRSELPLGFEWRYLYADSVWVVTSSRIPDLAAGDIVDSIDGHASEELYQELSYLVAGSSDYARRQSFGNWLLSPWLGESYSLAIRGRKGKVTHLAVDRKAIPEDTTTMQTTGRWLDESKIAYMKVPSWGQSRFQESALDLLDSFRVADCMIIDERGNGGGNTPVDFMNAIFDRPYRWWTEATPLSIALYRLYAEQGNSWFDQFRRMSLSWWSGWEQPDTNAYQGRVIVLVDRATGSAAEDFAMPFKDTGRGLLIGETTMGSTGQPYNFQFGKLGSIGIGAKDERMPDGSRFEGVGIAPDIAVAVSRDDLYEGADPVLDRAVKEARSGGK